MFPQRVKFGGTNMRKRLPTIFLAGAIATGAGADVYECTTTQFGNGGFVGEGYFLAFDRQAKAGSVLDWAIQQVHKAPIPVDVFNPSPSRWQFRYTVIGVQTSNSGSAKVSYRIGLNTQTNRFRISGRLHGYDNRITGRGTCRRVE